MFWNLRGGLSAVNARLSIKNSNMAKFFAKRRWNEEEIPILRGSQLT